MLLTPVYGDSPVLVADPPVTDPATPMVRQRARVAALLAGLDDARWAAPSRCAGWSVQDVVSHLVTVNGFWAWSIRAALAGEPTRLLATFDPVASPAETVAAGRGAAPADTLAQLVAANAALDDAVDAIGDRWHVLGEAPPGHVSLDLLAGHALWDSWVHERDIAVPLGLDQVVEADEVAMALRYVAALGPALHASRRRSRAGVVSVVATDPDLGVVIEIGDRVVVRDGPAPADAVRIEGDAVELVEALSGRAPFPDSVDVADRWIGDGLAEVFEQTG